MDHVLTGLFVFVAYACVHRFGWFDGLAVASTVWLLMPFMPFRSKR